MVTADNSVEGGLSLQRSRLWFLTVIALGIASLCLVLWQGADGLEAVGPADASTYGEALSGSIALLAAAAREEIPM